jgi:hypothetical protein
MDDGKPNLTTETRRHGEDQEIQKYDFKFEFDISSSPLSSFVSSAVNGFSVSTVVILTELGFDELWFCYIWRFVLPANSCRIGVRA